MLRFIGGYISVNGSVPPINCIRRAFPEERVSWQRQFDVVGIGTESKNDCRAVITVIIFTAYVTRTPASVINFVIPITKKTIPLTHISASRGTAFTYGASTSAAVSDSFSSVGAVGFIFAGWCAGITFITFTAATVIGFIGSSERTAGLVRVRGGALGCTGTRCAAFIAAADCAAENGVFAEVGLAGFGCLRIEGGIAGTLCIFGLTFSGALLPFSRLILPADFIIAAAFDIIRTLAVFFSAVRTGFSGTVLSGGEFDIIFRADTFCIISGSVPAAPFDGAAFTAAFLASGRALLE